MKITSATTLRHFVAGSFVLALFFTSPAAQAQQRPTMTTHVPEAVASGVAPLVGYVPGAQRMGLTISLPLRDESQLDNLIEQIYDPQSPSYHQYLSVREFTAAFGPTQADYASVIDFARANGLDVIDKAANRAVLNVEGSATNIESAFHITLGMYQHPTENRTFYAPDREPTTDLNVRLLHISGLDNFALHHSKSIRSSSNAQPTNSGKTTGSGPGGDFIGSDMRAAYYGSGPLDGSGQSVGLYEEAGYELSDVQNFFEKVKEPLNVTVRGVSVGGASLNCPPQTCDDGEQALDIEMAISMAPGMSEVIVYVGKSNAEAAIFNRMAVDNSAKQLSCSWGWPDDESSLDPIFKEMAVQGQTVFVATGDDGSGTPGNVVWPSDDPYVVAVGGTDLVTTGPGGAWLSETGWNGSAGSPSKNKIPIPNYQKLPGVITSLNHGSTTLRNYPDVSGEANTNQYSCFDGGCTGGNGGTSYAAPQWAGIMAMVNQQSVAGGGKTLGFINPKLYRIGVGSNYDADFHDITSGSNGGYTAVTGYDLVTGWGSPDVPSWIESLVAGK